MITASRVRLAVMIATVALAGCTAGPADTAAAPWSTERRAGGSGPVPHSTTAEELQATPMTVVPEPPKATTQAPPSPVQVQLPAGRVPPVLVGNWHGGVGAKTGEYLRISGDGFYERGVVGQSRTARV